MQPDLFHPLTYARQRYRAALAAVERARGRMCTTDYQRAVTDAKDALTALMRAEVSDA